MQFTRGAHVSVFGGAKTLMTSLSANLPSHPSGHARRFPDKPAYIMEPSGTIVTYRELEERSNRAAHLFRREGLRADDGVVLLLENNERFFELIWGAQRSGLRYTCASPKLSPAEVEYILRDCGAKLLVTSSAIMIADELPSLLPDVMLYNIGGARPGFRSYEAAVSSLPTSPIPDQSAGVDMLYSSGTTGRPKGIRRPIDPSAAFDAPDRSVEMLRGLYDVNETAVYLSPAPLYHAAPLAWCAGIMRLGGTVVIMERFDPELALALIQKHRISVAQFVPTHFIRMLKLPQAVRSKYDLSSIEKAVHAAAPCPIPTKQAMIDWWGPVLYEYYSGTEAAGLTLITSAEWLKKKGSVGRAFWGQIRICGENGEPLPTGEVGDVYFVSDYEFAYHNDPAKTASVRNKYGWSTMGDVGRLDEDGYLYLTDRRSFMIISGGVNIYPQEIENLIIQHPKVADVAVIGAPDNEMGERVVAIVQPATGVVGDAALGEEIVAFARQHLSHVKAPRQVDFMDELPRQDNGKLYKRLLRDRYWAGRTLVS